MLRMLGNYGKFCHCASLALLFCLLYKEHVIMIQHIVSVAKNFIHKFYHDFGKERIIVDTFSDTSSVISSFLCKGAINIYLSFS